MVRAAYGMIGERARASTGDNREVRRMASRFSPRRPKFLALALAPLAFLAQCAPSCGPAVPGPAAPTTTVVSTTTTPPNDTGWGLLEGDPRAHPNLSTDGTRLITIDGVIDTASGELLRAHPDPSAIPWRISPSGAAVLYQDGIGEDTWRSVFVDTGVATPVVDWCQLGVVEGWDGLVAVQPPYNSIDPCLVETGWRIPFFALSRDGRFGMRTLFLDRPHLVQVRDLSTDTVISQYEDGDWRPAGLLGISDEGHIVVQHQTNRQVGILPPGSTSITDIVVMAAPMENVQLITTDGSGIIGWRSGSASDPEIVLIDAASTTLVARSPATNWAHCPARLSAGGRIVSISYVC